MHPKKFISLIAWLVMTGLCSSCHKIDELRQDPEIEPLRQGFQASAAIGYCASLASAAFHNESLPSNVTFEGNTQDGYTGAGIIHIEVDEQNPIPFNSGFGDVYIAGLWDGDNGVLSIVFADVNLINAEAKFYGLHTVPVIKKASGDVMTVFAEQDIVIGEGSDTLLNLSLSKPVFNTEIDRLNSPQPTDAFAAIAQKVWFITIDQQETPSYVYDDSFEINGGGQIVEAKSNSGGVLYHALIGTRFNYDNCPINPTDGTGFIQNIKASGSSVDLGNITIGFHDNCDGKGTVKVATGKYVTSNGKDISLNF